MSIESILHNASTGILEDGTLVKVICNSLDAKEMLKYCYTEKSIIHDCYNTIIYDNGATVMHRFIIQN